MDPKTLRVLEYDKIVARLAEHTAFPAGNALARALLPSPDAAEVVARQAVTREARAFLDRRDGATIEGAHDIREAAMGAARGRVLQPAELLAVRATLQIARRVKRALAHDDVRWPGLAAMAVNLDPCPAVHDAIGDAIDDAGEVMDGASPELRRVRRQLKVVHDRITRQLQAIVKGAAKEYLQDALITQRNGRWVVPVKADFRGKVPGVVHDTSDSGATLFVEPLGVVDNGNAHRELVVQEQREIERVLRALSEAVGAEAEAMDETVRALARLDLAFAAARYGRAIRGVSPDLVDAPAPMLTCQAARHPLLDPEHVVPISPRIGDDFRLMVITGPNTGGKTVTLKTIGLLVLMAQAGLQIPCADGARLAVFDGVFADIGDEQSIEQSLSTFSGHMTNIIRVLADATPRSLVLLDELGAGTDPTEGAALAGAILETLRARGIACVASSHFTELKAYAYGTAGVANASVEFDVETLRPTYELTIGLPGRSNALAIAGRLGLPADIVEAARAGLTVSAVEMEELLSDIRAARRAAIQAAAAATERRQTADRWAAQLEGGVEALAAERAAVLDAAHEQARAELETAREAIARLLKRAERAA
ncbi:MAG: endonuclease MutS2, partial [Ardenticatenales bacterium]